MSPNESSRRARREGPLDTIASVTVSAYLFFDLIWQLVLRESASPALESLVFGTLMAQYHLLAIWAVLGTQLWYVRQLAAYLGVFGSYGCMLLGAPSDLDLHVIDVWLLLPLSFFCLQVPLWVARSVLRWRLVSYDSDGDVPTGDETRRFSLMQLFAAITFLAIAIAPVRWINLQGFDALVMGAVATGAGILVTLPCIWAAWCVRSVKRSTVVLMVYASSPAVVALIVDRFVEPLFRSTGDVIPLFVFPLALVEITHLILVAVRRKGFVLQWASKRPISNDPNRRATRVPR